jgi:hypothetical protein
VAGPTPTEAMLSAAPATSAATLFKNRDVRTPALIRMARLIHNSKVEPIVATSLLDLAFTSLSRRPRLVPAGVPA